MLYGISDKEDAIVGDPCAAEILVGRFAGGEEPVGDGIGDDAVDFFRHGPIAGADAAFDVGDRDSKFTGCDRAGHGRGDVPDHQAQVALVL